MVLKVGDRVAAYNHRGEREGKGVVVMTQALRGDYCKVKLDSGPTMAFRQDKVKKLVPKVDTNPKIVKVVVKMNDGTELELARNPFEVSLLGKACLAYQAPECGLWGAFLTTHKPPESTT